MWTAEPCVICQACFLRWHIVGAVNTGEVLRKYHTAFQFFCTWVGAAAEVHKGALRPELVPEFLGSLLGLVEAKRGDVLSYSISR